MNRLAITTLVLAVATSCSRQEAPQAETVVRPVRSERVFAAGAERVRTFSGAAKAGAEIRLSFKVPGTLRRLAVNVGGQVREGQTLAELDPRDYELQVQDVEASLAQARAQRRRSGADYERVRGLYENNNASTADLDAARTASESAEAAVRSVEMKLELAQLQLSYTTLISPVAGSVAEVPAEVNENVNAGQPIAILNSGARPEVEVAVPEALITRIPEGSRVAVRFDALGGRSFAARVTEVGVSPTRSATTFPVTVQLDRAESSILPGMAAEVDFRFRADGAAGRIIVPPQAVADDASGHFLYVIERRAAEEGVVHRRVVQVGELVSEGMEVLNGLEDGEWIVTAGVSQIDDGQAVKLLAEERN